MLFKSYDDYAKSADEEDVDHFRTKSAVTNVSMASSSASCNTASSHRTVVSPDNHELVTEQRVFIVADGSNVTAIRS